MNIRKIVDYSAMYAGLDQMLERKLSQMELYFEIGKLVSSRKEKGAAVAAAEYLAAKCQNSSGFSPRNLRRMRDFFRTYESATDILREAFLIGWTQNVVILEADLTMEQRQWYIRATSKCNWSKMELLRQINDFAHEKMDLDVASAVCYTDHNKQREEKLRKRPYFPSDQCLMQLHCPPNYGESKKSEHQENVLHYSISVRCPQIIQAICFSSSHGGHGFNFSGETDLQFLNCANACLNFWFIYGGSVLKKVLPYLFNEIKGAKYSGKWGDHDIPVFSVSTMHEFNQLVGYIKYKNAMNGTVLYRGQPRDHKAMLKPSGKRGNGCVSIDIIKACAEDPKLKQYLGLNASEISGWIKYQEIIISAVLQHYGAKTNCMDFVDNHWCALWFGLYRYDSNTRRYIKREDKENSLYIYLYLADTNCSSIRGIYIGEDTYTVDLRKALPSYFLRPASQHGWIVCGNSEGESSDYAEGVLCVIEVKVGDAESWLGNGFLLTPENFFPDPSIDDGYKVLLTRQERSGVYQKGSKLILPANTIQNYHFSKSFYSSDSCSCNLVPEKKYYADGKEIDSITKLYELLLQKGWTEETFFDAKWNPNNPCIGQSPATALVVQKIFGGTIVRYRWKKREHYFNRIADKDYDLTSQERIEHPFRNYSDCNFVGISKTSSARIAEKARVLLKNAGISETK